MREIETEFAKLKNYKLKIQFTLIKDTHFLNADKSMIVVIYQLLLYCLFVQYLWEKILK